MGHIFLVLHMSNNFGIYPVHCEYYGDSGFCYIPPKAVSLFKQRIKLVGLTLKILFLRWYFKFNISILSLARILCVFPVHADQWSVGDLGKEYTQNFYLLFYGSLLSRIFLSLSSGCRYELPVIFQTGKIVFFYRSFGSLMQCWPQSNPRLKAVKK